MKRSSLHVFFLICKHNLKSSVRKDKQFGGLGVSVLASGTQVRGFKPGRSRRIFKGGKILSTPPSEGK
jgi:hypothetical protein